MKTQAEISAKIKELQTQRAYLYNFLKTLYKNQHPKKQIENKLKIFDMEINALEWGLNGDDLPF